MDAVAYLHLPPGAFPPPEPPPAPFKAVLVLEAPAETTWRAEVAAWLARSGCRYALAWGTDCEAWHDAIDDAAFPGDPPDDDFIMTTWHDDEPLEEVAWFAAHAAHHPSLDLPAILIVHIAAAPDEAWLRATFQAPRLDSPARPARPWP
ncbi:MULTISPECIES: hypothetical protein [unclassified Caulobacter]|uniref:DUF7684 family protein n=1 Tax=unclassified Caulobacter TaxID=2648921 RepID=UPI0018EE931F|nr:MULTISPECIES: hypothetical protein [unclassified Caulobacter]